MGQHARGRDGGSPELGAQGSARDPASVYPVESDGESQLALIPGPPLTCVHVHMQHTRVCIHKHTYTCTYPTHTPHTHAKANYTTAHINHRGTEFVAVV